MGFYALAVLVGSISGIHIPLNSALGAKIQSPLLASVILFGVAITATGLAFLVTGNRGAVEALRSVPPWYFLPGLFSAVAVTSSTFLIPRIGAINLFVIVLSLQMISRMVISHYGWLSSPVTPISIYKMVGALMLMAGALLVVRN